MECGDESGRRQRLAKYVTKLEIGPLCQYAAIGLVRFSDTIMHAHYVSRFPSSHTRTNIIHTYKPVLGN